MDTEDMFDVSGDSQVRVERMDSHSGRWVFHGYMVDVSEALVAEKFGGGRYRCKLIQPDELGRKVIRKTREFTLPGAYREPADLPGVRPASIPPGGSTPEGGTLPEGKGGTERLSMSEMLNSAMVTQLLDIVKMTRQGAAPPAATGMPPWLEAIMPIVLVLVERLTERNKGPSAEVSALVEQLRLVQTEVQSLRSQGPVSSAMGDALKAVKELIEVRDMLVPGGGTSEPDPEQAMWALGLKALDKLGTAQAQPATTGGEVVPPKGAPGAVARTPAPLWQQMLQRHAGQLVNAAQRGMDPVSVAELAIQFLPAEFEGVAVEFVQRPDAAAVSVQVIPMLAQFPKWNALFWKAMREGLLEGGDDEPMEVEHEEVEVVEGE